jgi:hypothetical protein
MQTVIFGTSSSERPADPFYGKSRRLDRASERCSSNFSEKGEVDEAVRAFKKLYLEVVHRIIDHLKTEDAG